MQLSVWPQPIRLGLSNCFNPGPDAACEIRRSYRRRLMRGIQKVSCELRMLQPCLLRKKCRDRHHSQRHDHRSAQQSKGGPKYTIRPSQADHVKQRSQQSSQQTADDHHSECDEQKAYDLFRTIRVNEPANWPNNLW